MNTNNFILIKEDAITGECLMMGVDESKNSRWLIAKEKNLEDATKKAEKYIRNKNI